jgi:hypothetical protein
VYRVPASCETCASVWVVALSLRAKPSAAAARAWNLILGSMRGATAARPGDRRLMFVSDTAQEPRFVLQRSKNGTETTPGREQTPHAAHAASHDLDTV